MAVRQSSLMRTERAPISPRAPYDPSPFLSRCLFYCTTAFAALRLLFDLVPLGRSLKLVPTFRVSAVSVSRRSRTKGVAGQRSVSVLQEERAPRKRLARLRRGKDDELPLKCERRASGCADERAALCAAMERDSCRLFSRFCCFGPVAYYVLFDAYVPPPSCLLSLSILFILRDFMGASSSCSVPSIPITLLL